MEAATTEITENVQPKKTDKIFNIKENITTPLPDGLAQKLPRKGDIEYVSGTTIIDILNKVFDHSWSVEYSDPIIEPFTKGDNAVADKVLLNTIFGGSLSADIPLKVSNKIPSYAIIYIGFDMD